MDEAKANFRNDDGTLRLMRWAEVWGGKLYAPTGPRPVQMYASDGTAQPLLTNGRFGCDVIRFPAGGGVPTHTHEGDHILLCLAGTGYVVSDGVKYFITSGEMYFVEGRSPHSIEAITDFVLMSIANNQRPAGSPSRLELVES